jgi:hypothetical protein
MGTVILVGVVADQQFARYREWRRTTALAARSHSDGTA